MSSEISQPVDVVLLTKNSVYPCLEGCLGSIRNHVEVNDLIVVDGRSTDDTLEICKRYFPDCKIIIDADGNRATSRQKGIEAVQTEIFMFVDSDVILQSNWHKEALKLFSPQVGAVQGATYQSIEPKIEDFSYAMRRLRKFFGGLTYKPFLEPVHRGFTGDILIKTDLVKDIKIPHFLHFFEDHYIKRWIENKGLLWVRSPKAVCDHYMFNRSARVSYYASYISYLIGYVSLKRSLVALITIFPKVLFALCLRPNTRMAWWQLRFQFWSTMGAIKAYFNEKPNKVLQKTFQFKYGARKEHIETEPDYIQVI